MFQSRIDELKSQFGDRLSQKLHLIKSTEWNGINADNDTRSVEIEKLVYLSQVLLWSSTKWWIALKRFFKKKRTFFFGQTKSFFFHRWREEIFLFWFLSSLFFVCLFICLRFAIHFQRFNGNRQEWESGYESVYSVNVTCVWLYVCKYR